VQNTFASGLASPTALAFDNSGNLFVGTSNSIQEFTPGGVQSTFASGLDDPLGLAFNSAGDLFESDNGSGNIYEFMPGGAQSTFASGLPSPVGLAFNTSGDLFESDNDFGAIFEYTPGGVQYEYDGGFLHPFGLAFNGAGDLFVTTAGVGGAIIELTTSNGFAEQIGYISGLDYTTYLAFQGETLPVPEPSDLGLVIILSIPILVHRRRSYEHRGTPCKET
jgi:hypothetical protein